MNREERAREMTRGLWKSVGLDPNLAGGATTAEGGGWVKTKLSEASTEPPRMLVDGIVPAGTVGSIHAAGGDGKTLAAVYISLQAMWRGFRVGILDKENGAYIMRERFEMMGADLAALEQDGLIAFYDHPAAGREPETVAGYVAMLEAEKPDLLIIDAWVGFLGSCGFEENSATDIAAWSDLYATPARRRGIAVLLLDHRPKDGANRTARGSSRKRDYVDYQYELEKAGVIDRENTGIITLKLKKDRGAWLRSVHQFRVGGTASGFVFEPIDSPQDPAPEATKAGERATLDALEDGMTYAEWKRAANKPDSTFNRHRDDLEDAGLVVKRDGGWHRMGGRNSQPEIERPQRPNNAHGRDGRIAKDRASNAHNAHHPMGGRMGVPDGGRHFEDFAPARQGEATSKAANRKEVTEVATDPVNLSLAADAPGLRGNGGGEVVDGSRRLTVAEAQDVQRLIGQGMGAAMARAEVLAKDHPPDCACEVCE